MSRTKRIAYRVVAVALVVFACEQTWRHGHDYVFPEKFGVVEPGKLYRGAWQYDWPMRQIVRNYKIKTIVALAHPPDSPKAIEEKALADELGVRWIHIPIGSDRAEGDATLAIRLTAAADALADPANQPVYFHCHHGVNRASLAQMAYRLRHCGWTLQQAQDEIDQRFGLVEVRHGPDYRYMTRYYREQVLPRRQEQAARLANATTRRR